MALETPQVAREMVKPMTNFTPRPTTYKGIEMRSRLEAGFAAWLDQRNIGWEYEPCAFGSEAGQYLPDFRVLVVTTSGVKTGYIEVKPRFPDGHLDEIGAITRDLEQWPNTAQLARRMSVIFDSEPDAVPLLIWPSLEETRHPGVVTFLRLVRLAEKPEEVPQRSIFMSYQMLRTWDGAIHLAMGEWVFPWRDGYWDVQ